MTPAELDVLTRRLELVAHAATRVGRHLADLHTLAWEPTTNPDPDLGRVRGGTPDHTPKPGDPRARRLLDQLNNDVTQIVAELVGYERRIVRLFYTGSENAQPSRGVLISGVEHTQLLAKQQARQARGEYTPGRLEDQPHNNLGRDR